jgi:hypothetical protein
VLALSGLLAGGLAAQDVGYEGVLPGSGRPPPASQRLARRTAVILTWPGFQARDGGGSRFFVQTTRPVATEVRVTPQRIEVIFPRTTIHLANSRRWLETQFFNTPVERARLERRGRNMALVLHLRAQATPRVSVDAGEGGFYYTYVDFDPGDYLPATPAEVPQPQGGLGYVSGSSAPPQERTTDPSWGAMDEERPPPVRTGPEP